MSSSDIKEGANAPTAPATPVQNPASLPHGTTQDQVNEMESEGGAAKQGQPPNPSAPSTQTPMPRPKDQTNGAR